MYDIIGVIGRTLTIIGFAAALVSVFSYFASYRGNRKWIQTGRYSYHAMALSVITAATSLLFLILTHQFQYTYVWNYSSTDLPTHFLVSTFFAGQEGSFMLWALFTAALGVILMYYTAKRDYEPQVMSIFVLVEVFLLVMVVIKNPFEHIWDSFPKDVIKTGPIPQGVKAIGLGGGQWVDIPLEGRGLNPLLQNIWMVIHPPILFMGFTLMAAPFCLSVAALIRREYQKWVNLALPWVLLPAMVLGAGLILGGFWAYETLGWGIGDGTRSRTHP
jgi:cytochrome c-type biogenesis protein CcmF